MKAILIIVLAALTFWIIAKTGLYLVAVPAYFLGNWLAQDVGNADLDGLWGWALTIAGGVVLLLLLG